MVRGKLRQIDTSKNYLSLEEYLKTYVAPNLSENNPSFHDLKNTKFRDEDIQLYFLWSNYDAEECQQTALNSLINSSEFYIKIQLGDLNPHTNKIKEDTKRLCIFLNKEHINDIFVDSVSDEALLNRPSLYDHITYALNMVDVLSKYLPMDNPSISTTLKYFKPGNCSREISNLVNTTLTEQTQKRKFWNRSYKHNICNSICMNPIEYKKDDNHARKVIDLNKSEYLIR